MDAITPDLSLVEESGDTLQVVVLEPDTDERETLCATLSEAGLAALSAQSVAHAMQLIERSGADIFITAEDGEAATGLEACWRLKADAVTAHVHTIVLTASTDRERVAEALDAGADDFIRKPFDRVELKARLRAAARIVRLQRRLRAEAETDALTGAANRRAFLRALDREIEDARALRTPLALLMIDLDHFKRINDTHGHAAGDRVLARSVAAFKAELSSLEMLGRLGGEEFAVILPRADLAAAQAAAERLRLAAQHLRVENDRGEPISVTTSLGLACMKPGARETASDLLRRADEGLYAAKAGGRNQVMAA